MKLMHLSDLHIGKRLCEQSLLEDQTYILDRIVELAAQEQPEAIIIAGDLYDKATPPAEAVALCDDFLCRLSALGCQLLVISGNHDSAERVAFGGRLMERSGVHISPVYDGHVQPVTLKDVQGEVDIFMLPFVKPVHVRAAFPDEEIQSYTDALRVAVEHMPIREGVRSVLVTHQFVTGATRSESEEISVGGSDNVDASVFAPFDYVALGHLHKAQSVGRPEVRYCGTPLKYSFSEAKNEKSVTMVELGRKGNISIREVPLSPMRDMAVLHGSFAEVSCRIAGDAVNDPFARVVLTDEDDIPDAFNRLRIIYPNLLQLEYDNIRTRHNAVVGAAEEAEQKSPLQLLEELFERQCNQPMSEHQRQLAQRLISEIWEDE